MKAGSAAKLIVDSLLQRFLPLARRRIETAQAQVRLFDAIFVKYYTSLLADLTWVYAFLEILLQSSVFFGPR